VNARLARVPNVRVGAVIALAVAAGLVTAMLIDRSGNGPAKPVAANATKQAKAIARIVSADQLRTIAASRDPVVYWAGPRASRRLELTETPQGRIYVRYLTPHARAGDRRAAFLTVATYPLANAFGALKAAAKRAGAAGFALPRGGVAVYDRTRPTNLYVAYPNGDEQIEVFSPSPAEARRLVQRGRIRPLNDGAVAPLRHPRAVSAAELQAIASTIGPIYWAGPRGKVYEVTRTWEGRVYVRYLRRPADLGSPRADLLTVATYPDKDAFGDIQAASRRPGSVSIQLANGGIAVYDRSRPTSVYLAYPGAKEQIEVFDPAPNRARLLVQAGRIQPVA
jgi:hypothetical protein